MSSDNISSMLNTKISSNMFIGILIVVLLLGILMLPINKTLKQRNAFLKKQLGESMSNSILGMNVESRGITAPQYAPAYNLNMQQ